MIETIIGHFQHRILSTWLILDQVFAGRRRPGFPNSFFRPETPALYPRSLKKDVHHGFREKNDGFKDQNGRDVDVLRSSVLACIWYE